MNLNLKTVATMISSAILILLVVAALHFRRPEKDPGAIRPADIETPTVTHQIADTQWVVSKRDRDLYLQDLAKATRDVSLKPEPGEAKDSVSHLTIVSISDGSPLYRAGFRLNDAILKVNGTPIGTMGRAINLVHEIGSATDLTVQVLRAKETIDYSFQFR